MQEALEIARFTVKPEAETQFLAEREQVIAHLRHHFAGRCHINVNAGKLSSHQEVSGLSR